MEDYLTYTVLLLWLLKGGIGFTQDRYLQDPELLTDSQTMV